MTYLAARIPTNPKTCGGKPCLRDLRIRVSEVRDLLAAGRSPEQVVAELLDLELEDVQACLTTAAQRVSHPVLPA